MWSTHWPSSGGDSSSEAGPAGAGRAPSPRVCGGTGSIAGMWLFAGYALQTGGLTITGATNSALITGLYVVFVPLLAAISRKRPPSPWAWSGSCSASSARPSSRCATTSSSDTGDLLTVGCAIAFAGHIVTVARQATRHPVIPYTTVQLLTTAALGLVGSVVFEGPGLPDGRGWPAIILTGLGVSAIAYLLQVWAQNRVGPSRTAILLTLEPVFAVAAAGDRPQRAAHGRRMVRSSRHPRCHHPRADQGHRRPDGGSRSDQSGLIGYLLRRWTSIPVRLLRAVLIVAAVALAAVPLFVLLDLAQGGSGYGLCPDGVSRCRNPYTAAPELSTLLTIGLVVVLGGLRVTNRMLRRLQRPRPRPRDDDDPFAD
jgi:hypothetical protein